MNSLRSPSALRLAGAIGLLAAGAFLAPASSAADVSINLSLQAPPPPRHEVIVERERPSPNHVWVEGYWGGSPGRYTWVQGHWERPPHAGSHWIPPRWDRDRDGRYVLVKGRWR